MSKKISEQLRWKNRFIMGAGQPAFVIFNSLGIAVDKVDDWIYPRLGIDKILEIIGWE